MSTQRLLRILAVTSAVAVSGVWVSTMAYAGSQTSAPTASSIGLSNPGQGRMSVPEPPEKSFGNGGLSNPGQGRMSVPEPPEKSMGNGGLSTPGQGQMSVPEPPEKSLNGKK